MGFGSLFLTLLGIKGWRLSLSIPWELGGDATYSQMQVKDILDHGWQLTNSSLGAPYGGQGFDYPEGDSNLNFLIIKILGFGSSDSATVLNLFWLLGFPAAAISAWAVARKVEIPAWPAMFFGVMFSILPYHFWRGEGHMLLSAYYFVPLACLLVLRVLGKEPLFERAEAGGGRIRPWLTRRTVGTVVICLVLGSANVYYAAFTILLLMGATIVTLDRRATSAVVGTVAAIALIVGMLAINLSPTFIYQAEHGKNELAAMRSPRDSEYLGLTLTQLLLPEDNHRISRLSRTKSNYRETSVARSESAQSLGLIGSLGFLWLVFLLGATALGRRLRSVPEIERKAAVAAAIAFLIGTVGGISSFIAFWISPQLRGWNRISIFIGFFALLAVASLLARAPRPFSRYSWGRFVPGAAITLLLAVALFDQASPARVGQFDPDYINPPWKSDGAFVAELDDSLPEGSAVYQMPWLGFPEGYPFPGVMGDYDPLRGFLHSDDLRWSYGAAKGRAADLGACIQGYPTSELLPILAAAGFDAVWIDRNGYSEADDANLELAMAGATGAAPLESPDGRFAAFSLKGLRADPALVARLEPALPADGDALADCAATQAALDSALQA